jgi:hypothetical protein
MWLEITAFDGNTLSGTGGSPTREMVAMSETAGVVSRIVYLDNGAKFDADGAADSDTVLGQVVARFRLAVSSGTLGLRGLNDQLTHYAGKRGHVGTLTGISRSTSDVTYQCSARCIDVTEEEVSVEAGSAPGGKYRAHSFVVMTWEKLSEWAQV